MGRSSIEGAPSCSSIEYYEESIEDNKEIFERSTQEETTRSFLKPPTPRRKVKKIFKNCDTEDPQIQQSFEFLQQRIPEENSTSIFSKYIAKKLNQFDPRTKSILIHKINGLIFEAEMNMYSTNNHLSPPSLSSSSDSICTSTPPPTDENLDYTESKVLTKFVFYE